MTTQRHDFAKPGRLPGDLAARLAGWLAGACALATKNWTAALPFPLEASFRGSEVLPARAAQAALPDPAVATRLTLGPGGAPTLLALPRPLALAVVAGLLGEPVTVLPEDRELTAVELSLYDYFLQDLWAPALRETWPGAEGLRADPGPHEPHPRWARLFPPGDSVVACSFGLTGPFGEQRAHWLCGQAGLWGLFGAARPAADLAMPSALEGLVRELPVEITVVLGEACLPLAGLADLKPGDVVLLDRRLSEPLAALVAGAEKFRGWAGRTGSRQSFQIEGPASGEP